MSVEDLKKFKERVLSDLAIQESLKTVEDEQSFIDLAIRLGQEKGYIFTAEELRASMGGERLANMTFGEKAISRIRENIIRNNSAFWYKPRLSFLRRLR